MNLKDNNFEAHYKELPTAETAKDNEDSPENPITYGYGVRHVQVFLAFASITLGFIARAHLGVTIVAMTSKPSLNHNDNNTTETVKNITRGFESNSTVWEDIDYENVMLEDDFDQVSESMIENYKSGAFVEDEPKITVQTYDWPKATQEMVLGAFFLGYALMMFPMGMICQRWGGKLPMQMALFVNGLISLVSPWLAAWGGWKAVCACRILQGCSQSGFFPSVQMLVSKWSHRSERSVFLSLSYTGTTLGTIIGFQVSGLLSSTSVGWPSTFWTTGVLCLMMCIILSVFGAASPAEHKSISKAEKRFIISGTSDAAVVRRPRVPWKAILTSRYVWANVVTHIGSGVAFVFFFTQVPSYIHHILKMDVKKSGMLSSLPYVGSFFMSIVYGYLSDFLTNRKILRCANARKVFNSISQYGLAVCFVAVSFTNNVELALVCLVMAMSVQPAVHTGWMLNHIDLSPNFSSTLMAFGNTFACASILLLPVTVACVITDVLNHIDLSPNFSSTLMAFGNTFACASILLLPVTVACVITDVTNQLQWRIMFISMAALAVTANTLFVIFMTSDTQPWNDYGFEDTETGKTHKEEKTP